MSLEISIQGSAEVIAKLAELSRSVENRIVERAGRAALKPVTAAVRARCPQTDEGHLRKSIGVKKAKRTPKGTIVLSVGPRRGYAWEDANGKKHDPFFYGIPVEYGHVVLHPKTKATIAVIPPVGMVRAAYDLQKDAVVDRMEEEMATRIEEALP